MRAINKIFEIAGEARKSFFFIVQRGSVKRDQSRHARMRDSCSTISVSSRYTEEATGGGSGGGEEGGGDIAAHELHLLRSLNTKKRKKQDKKRRLRKQLGQRERERERGGGERELKSGRRTRRLIRYYGKITWASVPH